VEEAVPESCDAKLEEEAVNDPDAITQREPIVSHHTFYLLKG
jgi:hypothetical protein